MPSAADQTSPLILEIRQRLTAKQIAFRDQIAVETVHARRLRGEYPGAKLEGREYRWPPDVAWTSAPEAESAATAAQEAADALAGLRAWRAA